VSNKIIHITVVVEDYDEAIAFYIGKLGFVLIEDTILTPTKRWVLVSPSKSAECHILLAKATNEEQASRVGNQSGGRVFLFLHTDDCLREYNRMLLQGVKFIREPKTEDYGIVAVFQDLYGNLWDLIERRK
jgi:catechol 2,3-dioxygenase-like lactoylglutathione lyase family enzyme